MLINLFLILQLVNNSLLRTLLLLTAIVWAVASLISTLFPGKKGGKCSCIRNVFQGVDWNNDMAGGKKVYRPDQNSTPGTFYFMFFPFQEVRSPNSWEFGQWGCFSKCAVRKLPDWRFLKCYCPKSPAMPESSNSWQNMHSQYVTFSCRGQSICFNAKKLFGVFLLCLCHNLFYVMFLCLKFFSYFSLWGLPWKLNINNCKKILEACRSFKNFWIYNWFFAL